MIINIKKLRILGSSFTEEEYRLYGFDQLDSLDDAMRYLSHRQNHGIFRPAVNQGFQQHFLEDKWASQVFLSSMNLPVPKTYGLYHPQFGLSVTGSPMRTSEDVAAILETELPEKLIIKPRGGRKGGYIFLADFSVNSHGTITVAADGHLFELDEFLASLPEDAFGDYGGCYHGWLLQRYISQHETLDRINPYTVNSLRVVTFINASQQIQIRHAVLKLGRKGCAADNWDKGGLSVYVDPDTGRLGQGVFKPHYGGTWTSVHPDTGVRFEGETLPHWPSIKETCRRASAMFSGTRAIGWDIAVSGTGPIIIEGNATWGLPIVQVHTNGCLTDEFRKELRDLGVHLPEKPRSLPAALYALIVYQWRRSRGPNILFPLANFLRKITHIT